MNGRAVRESRIAALSALTVFFAILPWTAFAWDWNWYIWPLMYAFVALVATSAVARVLRMPRIVVALAQLLVAAEAILIGIAGTWRPDATAWALLSARMDASITVARQYEAPVPHGVIMLAPLMIVLGVSIVVVFDLLAATLRRPGLAGLLLLAVQTTTGALVDEPLSWVAFLLSALAFGALLASVREVSLIGWTSLRRGDVQVGGQSTEEFNTRTASLRIGITAAALAVVAPFVVPMYGSGTFQALKTNTGAAKGPYAGAGLAHPFLDMKKNLVESKTVSLVVIASLQRPSYFRYAVLDNFDGSSWSQGGRDFTPLTPQISPDGLTYGERSGDQDTFEVQTMGAYDATTLPAPYPPGALQSSAHPAGGQPTTILVDQNTWEIKPESDGGTAGNYQFTASQYLQGIQRAALNQAPPATGPIEEQYTKLPAGSNWLKPIAEKVTEKGSSDYQKVLLLEDWFRHSGGFVYSLQSGTGSGMDQIRRFLSDNPADRVGYCEQFSTSMALLARSLGIPSRVVVGFLNPQADPQTGDWQFTTKDLHAWPEIYFPGTGWVPFEPTPSARTGTTVPGYQVLSPRLEGESNTTSPTHQVTPSSVSAPPSSALTGHERLTLVGVPLADLLWLVLVLLLGLLGALPRTAAWAMRGWRRRRASTARARTEAAWREVIDLAEDLGYESVGVAPTLRRTAQELSTELAHTDPVRGPVTAAALSRLALEVEAARYAPEYQGVATLEDDWNASLKGLDACVSPRRRRRATWWPLAVFRQR